MHKRQVLAGILILGLFGLLGTVLYAITITPHFAGDSYAEQLASPSARSQ